jgi:hypothetical protein
MSSYVSDWAWAFAFTQLVEVPIFMRYLGCSLVRAFGASALTHPVIWYVFPHLRMGYVPAVAVAELFAWLAEASYFVPTYRARRSLWIAFLANAASAALGALSRFLFGAP